MVARSWITRRIAFWGRGGRTSLGFRHTRQFADQFFFERVPPLCRFGFCSGSRGFLNYEELLGPAERRFFVSRHGPKIMCFDVLTSRTTGLFQGGVIYSQPRAHWCGIRSVRTPRKFFGLNTNDTKFWSEVPMFHANRLVGHPDWPRPLLGTKQVWARAAILDGLKLAESDGAGKKVKQGLAGVAHSPGHRGVLDGNSNKIPGPVGKLFPIISRVPAG